MVRALGEPAGPRKAEEMRATREAGSDIPGGDILERHLPDTCTVDSRHGHADRQLVSHVAGMTISECAEVLSASPIALSFLAAGSEVCRVIPGETRGFEGVIRARVLHVFAKAEQPTRRPERPLARR